MAVLGIIFALAQPEVRRFIGLDHSSLTPTATVGITGKWVGKIQNFTDTLSLTQTGNSIAGVGMSQSQTDTFSETINGSITDNLVELTEYINENECDASYTLTLSQDRKSLSSYYTGCNNDRYAVTLTKQ